MPVDTTNDKSRAVSKLQGYCTTILDTINLALLLRQEAIDKGYQPGGTDAITNTFLQTGVGNSPPPFPQLADTDLTASLTAIASIDTTLAAATRTGYKALEKLRA